MNMTTEKAADAIDVSRMVYIRELRSPEIAELPNEALEDVEDLKRLFVLTNAEGVKIAIVEGREAALATARANALVPMSVH